VIIRLVKRQYADGFAVGQRLTMPGGLAYIIKEKQRICTAAPLLLITKANKGSVALFLILILFRVTTTLKSM